jgi:hypothetical protein
VHRLYQRGRRHEAMTSELGGGQPAMEGPCLVEGDVCPGGPHDGGTCCWLPIDKTVPGFLRVCLGRLVLTGGTSTPRDDDPIARFNPHKSAKRLRSTRLYPKFPLRFTSDTIFSVNCNGSAEEGRLSLAVYRCREPFNIVADKGKRKERSIIRSLF